MIAYTFLRLTFAEATKSDIIAFIGSTDKFSTIILTHLFCPHCVGKSST